MTRLRSLFPDRDAELTGIAFGFLVSVLIIVAVAGWG